MFAVLAGGIMDCRTPRRRRFVDGDRVIGGVSGDAYERAIDRGEQIEAGGRIITRLLGQRVALLHESSLARTDRILTGRCDMTLVGRGRSSD